jgi:lipopolysaccharide export system permease protein
LARLAAPVGIFATGVFLLALALALYVRPWGNSHLRAGLYEIVKSRASAGIKPRVFNDDFKGLVIYVDDIEPPGNLLRGIVISDTREGGESNTVFARSGTIISSEESQTLTLRLHEGGIYTASPRGRGFQDTRFSTYDINLDLNLFVADARKRESEANELTYAELRAVVAEKSAAHEPAFEERVEIQRKFAIPFACFVFAALGLPLGIHSTRAVHSRGLATSLTLIFVYYLLLTLAQTLGERGTVIPEIALWTPNLILSAVAAWLVANRRHGTAPSGTWRMTQLASQLRNQLWSRG